MFHRFVYIRVFLPDGIALGIVQLDVHGETADHGVHMAGQLVDHPAAGVEREI